MEGKTIVIEDARGCWKRHDVAPRDIMGDGVFWLAGQLWQRMPFEATPETRGGVRVYRCAKPAIGPADAPYSPLYLPQGWHAPEGAQA